MSNSVQFRQRFPDFSNKQSFWMGCIDDKVPVLISTVRTSPSLLWTTLVTRPMYHCPLGKLSSTSSTRSPMSAFWQGFCRFCLSCKAGIYSFNRLFQICSAKTCACLHFFITSTSSFTKEPGDNECTALCRSCWLGDRGSRSYGSFETAQSGLWNLILPPSQPALLLTLFHPPIFPYEWPS